MNGTHVLPAAMQSWLDKTDRQPITAIDSHTGGNPTRIVMSGIELPEKVQGVDATRAWLRDHADHWRRRLVHEPRGGGLTCAVLPVATREDGCDIGAVILEPGSYPPMCGHCMIGFASVIVELNLLPEMPVDADGHLAFRIRTPAGPIGVTARSENGELSTVTIINVESYVVRQDDHKIDGRIVPVELLYGGDYYISVDASTIGLSLDRANATEIVRVARALRSSYVQHGVRDPLDDAELDVYQVLFYRHDVAQPDQANIVVVAPPGVIDRSPCGTGSSAFFAKLITQGLLAQDQPLTTTSIIGSTFRVAAQQLRRTPQRLYITPALTGRAYINGFLLIAADADDELADGFAPL
ncbi:proline racemase family protein [Candidatus Pantoea formicae]|uniref:proline racemase family protein n=1 Tax=Candidatus Pantoea formicae TaxID=2608355 RepID=UPI003EDA5C9F